MGVIFLTIFIDLLGFTIIFPLFPAILDHYFALEGNHGVLGALLGAIDRFAAFAGSAGNYRAVLFGGVLGSLYALLQFVFSPVWGSLSDRIGRRRVLLITVSGTALSYLLWFFSGSFLLFIFARLLGGGFAGNLSVATAAVADVTTRENRAKGMGIVGVAFGLGFLFGPAVGSIAAFYDLSAGAAANLASAADAAGIVSGAAEGTATVGAGLLHFAVNPFSLPALLALGFSLINLVWIALKFRETLNPAKRGEVPARVRSPIGALMELERGPARRTNWLHFVFSLAFSGMEFSLPFLATERFGYAPTDMFKIFVFLGLVLIFTQGLIVRRAVPKFGEKAVLICGLLAVCAGITLMGTVTTVPALYLGLALAGMGSGFINPTVSALVSLYSPAEKQGLVLGVYRSLGSLARALGPLVACFCYWWQGATATYLLVALVTLAPWLMAIALPRPIKNA
ncbi:hypothetical protein AXK11_06905 [Cephaloticoccus primus]|uniref:Major facilitator superfamily (MFS) profile domain-containing protein n=1 Tax=Cephaloticoccus primus TaxID=1548207 RepID=A0A139SKT0_9BACT|nr:hypothetical protein AXK11_06905 [Cephaloticoccus primus]